MASRTRPRAPSSVRRCISSSRNKVSVFRGAGREWRVLAALVKDTYLRWNRVCVKKVGGLDHGWSEGSPEKSFYSQIAPVLIRAGQRACRSFALPVDAVTRAGTAVIWHRDTLRRASLARKPAKLPASHLQNCRAPCGRKSCRGLTYPAATMPAMTRCCR